MFGLIDVFILYLNTNLFYVAQFQNLIDLFIAVSTEACMNIKF